ncbi:response regulator [Nitrincola sp. MINF-07-Sa-05]|uniref:response regulator n=1 Tax=Nitrincola salilacus TaxID=3400273 RepID=UPI00391801F9
MIKVLLSDDHNIVREGIKRLFELTQDITVAAEATNGNQLLTILDEVSVDLVLLDMSMPGISGANLIKRVAARHPALPILVLSMHNEILIARRALKAGASGYLTKDSEPEVLLGAIRKVAQGQCYICPELAEQMIFSLDNAGTDQAHELLSERELEIMLLLAKGTSVNDIATQLSISNKTVSTHKLRFMQKLNLNTNADLIRYAVENSLIA